MSIEIFKTRNKQFCARIKAKNGKEIWRTSETYKTKAGVMKAIYALQIIVCDTIDDEIADLTKARTCAF